MKNIFLIIILLSLVKYSFSQETSELATKIVVEDCIELALRNYKSGENKELIETLYKLKSDKTSKSYYPGLQLNAQATYQSEVTEMDFSSLPFPVNIESSTQDQYKATLDITQPIYDGGLRKTQKSLYEAQKESELATLAVNDKVIKSQVLDLYFGMLEIKKKIEVVLLTVETLKTTEKQVEVGIENEVLLPSDLYLIQTEIITLYQAYRNLRAKETELYSLLGEMLNIILDDLEFVLPEIDREEAIKQLEELKGKYVKPEIAVITKQEEILDNSKQLLGVSKKPQLYGFGQLGYGRPGLNFLSNEFGEFYIVGAKLSWNIWDWNQVKLEQEAIEVQKQILDTKKYNLQKSLNHESRKVSIDLNTYKRLLEQDDELLKLRKKITEAYSSQLKNGTITTSEYIKAVNQEKTARLNSEINQILYTKAKYEYSLINGIL